MRRERRNPDPWQDTIIAFHDPARRGKYFNEWAGGDNVRDFVTSAVNSIRAMRKKGGTPYMIVTTFEDYPFPSSFGERFSNDVFWLSETYNDLIREARAYEEQRRR